MLGAPALTALLTPSPPPRTLVPVFMLPVRTPAFQLMPSSPGVMVSVGQPVAAEYSQVNPCAPVSEVVPPMKTQGPPTMPLVPGVGAETYSAVAVKVFPLAFPPIVHVA